MSVINPNCYYNKTCTIGSKRPKPQPRPIDPIK